ncbi:MAG: leucine-rich repeat protein [Clostridia bacterium]
MILKMKYHCDTGLLIPFQKYTLAQNNHLADTIVINSTDPNCRNYKYCLEFVCYNSKNVPKASYITNSFDYGADGINFVVPNNLTQYRGYVDIQLSGFDKTNNTIIFKSVSKNAKAFDVEGSLAVLENAISDTPNILTDMEKELNYFRSIESNLITEFLATVNNDLGKLIAGYHYNMVYLWDYDKLVGHQVVVSGSKAKKPSFTLPPNTVENGGWYNIDNGNLWDWDFDVVNDDVNLVANYHTQGLTFAGAKVTGYTLSHDRIFVPPFHDRIKITAMEGAGINLGKNISFQLPYSLTNIPLVKASRHVTRVDIDKRNTAFVASPDGAIYTSNFAELYFYPNGNPATVAVVNAQCSTITERAFADNAYVKSIVLPSSVAIVKANAFDNCALVSKLELGLNVSDIGDNIINGCAQISEIFLSPTTPPTASATSFVIDPHTNKMPSVFVPTAALANYKASGVWALFHPKAYGDFDYKAETVALEARMNTAIDTKIDQERVTTTGSITALQRDKLNQTPRQVTNWNSVTPESFLTFSDNTTTNNPSTLYSAFCGLRVVKETATELLKLEIIAPQNNNKLYVRSTTGSGINSPWRDIGGVDDTYPVGSLFFTVSLYSPAQLFGGSWTRYAQGRTIVGLDENDTSFSTLEQTGGEKTHTLNVQEMPSHRHNFDAYDLTDITGDKNYGLRSTFSLAPAAFPNCGSSATGSTKEHNNLQPYIAVYIWRRVE